MSRTTLPGRWVLVVLLLTLAAPAGAHASAGALPHVLPPAHAARAAHVEGARWLIAARPSASTRRIANAFGARPLRLRGAYVVATPRARALARALRRTGALRYAEPDVALARQSTYEGADADQGWTRGAVVAAGLTPPAAFAPIGILDDVVDAAVADVAQVKILSSSPTKTLALAGGRPETAHGTEVASVAAGRADGQGVIGIAPGAPLLSFGYRTLSCAEVADGVLDLAAAGAKVINLSFSTEQDCHTLQLATAAAFGDGAIVVAAAGNELRRHNPVLYPAAYPHVLSVGALGLDLAPASFSSAGTGVDVLAPGEAVPVALPPAFDQDGTADGLTRADGTSFAAPIVSGVASWLEAARPNLSAGQYGDLLRASAQDADAPGWDARSGYGRVNLAGALTAPVPAADRGEPNDGIDFVDGSAFTKPDAYAYSGGAARTVKATVAVAKDAVDVYRVRLRARATATARLLPAAGAAADLYAYAGTARSLAATPVARSRRPGSAADVVHLRNRTAKARTFYVAVRVAAGAPHAVSDAYTLKLAR